MNRIFLETDGVALVRQRPGRTHILTGAHTGDSELSSYVRVFPGITDEQVLAFGEEVNTCGEIRCLLPQFPISALPEAALRGACQNPDRLRYHIADFISGIPALNALSPFEHLVVALACFDAEDWVTQTLEEVLREHAVQLEGRTVHLCVRHQPIHSKAHRPYGALEGDNHLTAVPLPSCSPNAFGGARRLLAEASEQGAEIYWYP